MTRYQWFLNKDQFNYDTQGVEIEVDKLKLEVLDKNKQFVVSAKNKNYVIEALASCPIKGKKQIAKFGVSGLNKSKLFVVRLNTKLEYDSSLLYRKSNFLSLCTAISRKFKLA